MRLVLLEDQSIHLLFPHILMIPRHTSIVYLFVAKISFHMDPFCIHFCGHDHF
jgi:hypothetical protein